LTKRQPARYKMSMVSPDLGAKLGAVAGAAGIAVTCLVFMLLKRSWGRLAQVYRLSRPFPADAFGFQHGQLGFLALNGCLTFGADREGVYVRTWPVLGWLIDPLFIPWTDMQESPGGKWDCSNLHVKWWSGGFVELKFPAVQGISLKISAQLWRALNAKR
jgi:hypothetical protein